MPKASAPTPLFDNAAGQISANPAGFLHLHWKSQLRTLAETQALLRHLGDALLAYGWQKVLGNQLVMPPLTPKEQAWAAQHWLPEAVHTCGYRIGAIVVATDLYARLATSYVTTNLQGLPLRYRSFDNEADALAWLVRQE